ncbi:hypothetical protein Salat_1737300 [Sesamum alatum]|uniref:Uncharacterized protein n=1 Tax=Sesamum alatum TaxID=300844 RepID=A0AAE2CKE9_9LAMI|nr:hypothetical protein Salat_1737300 [Sesamum alatum]
MYFKKKELETELVPLVESTRKRVRRISRCSTKVINESAEDSRQTEDSGETSGQRRFPGDSSQQTTAESSDNTQVKEASSGKNIKVGKLEASLPRFGPLFGADQKLVKATKKKAWKHVLKKSSKKDPSSEDESSLEDDSSSEDDPLSEDDASSEDDDRLAVKDIYLTAIRKVEKDAREIYGDKSCGLGSNFRWMMIRDGCFFLQLAFLILGIPEQLGYPSNNPIFGHKRHKKDAERWIEAMFFVGNQIPLVVLKELMKQKFFQDVIARGKWDTPPSDLCKKVLYELLILPALNKHLPPKGGSSLVDHEQPSDLLHGLQNLVLGPGPPGNISGEYKADDDIDLEANADYFGGSIIDDEDDDETSPTDNVGRIRMLLKATGFRNATGDRKTVFPSATELERAGIHIKKLKSGGVRSICFKSWYFWAYLYLPVFPVDEHTELIFRNLKIYELSQQLGKHRQEVSSYLRFMSDLNQTTRDAKLLQKQGIIKKKSDYAEKLPGILDRLSSDQDIRLTHELHAVRRQISDYSSPWIHYKVLANLVAVLTVLQTLFALLAYFKPPKA